MHTFIRFFLLALTVLAPEIAFAASGGESAGEVTIPISPFNIGAMACVAIFVLSYVAVLFEEKIHLSKSKPVMLGAGLIWIIIGIIAPKHGIHHDELREAVFHGLIEYSSLLLFLLAAMTYITAMQDRNVFAALRGKLVQAGMNMRQLFWATGAIAFCLSPIADNLTTALVIGAVIMAMGKSDKKFIALACVNVVNAANAGGAFSPFGDITTLMVWQAKKVTFFEFFDLLAPSFVNFFIPALVMSFFVSKDLPEPLNEEVSLKPGAKTIIGLGVLTIATAVSFENFLGLPPFMGMMMGLSLLMMFSYFIRFKNQFDTKKFDIFTLIERAEWDTLLFFFGVIFSVGGLAFLGYMELLSSAMYEGYGPGFTNIALGIVSAVVDNIPIMFAVITMNPEMSHFHWLLITLTAGVGGSLLSIGSAAGVALMGVSRGHYTFLSHLKWAPILLLGYIAAIGVHYMVNSHLMAY
ncbi:MAG: sodium:proton antiporter NhaD [Alphaproteobacteria bacterium]|nr:sodium:proton antiporter NhaD [Alphaproteobacteria bacterium]